MSSASYEFRSSVDFNQNELRNATFQRLTTPPISPVQGQIYYNTPIQVPFYWNETRWLPFGLPPVHIKYTNLTTLIAGQSLQVKGYIYYRTDVDIYYEYLGTILGTIADYNPIGGAGTLTGYEPAFSKGSLIQGGAVSLTGTLISRLVGTGDITIAHADTSTQVSSANTAGSIIQNITLDTYGHNTALASINGDDRWARRHVLIDSTSTWLYTSEAATFPGIHVGQTTTGSTNFPSTLGGFAIFGGAQTNSVSYFARVFGFFRQYDSTNVYVGTANDNGANNGWALLYTSYNLNLGTLGGEPAFTKGSLIAGTNITLDGTISNRLVGTGDVTINAAGQVPIRQRFSYAGSNIFSLSYSAPNVIYVTLNGQVLQEGSIYDWTISGTNLTLNPILETGDEISILYYTALPTVTNYGRNIDGGAPDSVYLAIQNVNGGTP